MKLRILAYIPGKIRKVVAAVVSAGVLAVCNSAASGHEVKDLKYGAVLFEFYQQKYFETLVEYEYAAERGGIHNHGNYPELLKGGVSLSYGLDLQANEIFSRLIANQSPEEVRNRAWFYLAKMLYLRGEIERAATVLSNVSGAMSYDINQEYRYLAALINIKLGYFDEAKAISSSFEDDSAYAPYLYFNLGVALGKQRDYIRAVTSLEESASYADGSDELDRLADRAHMAIAFLYADQRNFADAYAEIKHVSTSGVTSNRALLGSGWASVNSGSYREALAPLTLLQQRAMAIPEVQEAVLLVPHVYEKLGLEGRAAQGFIKAYDRYSETLEKLEKAKKTLADADVLELFVKNLDAILGESDWFGTAPSVSLNSLSPFLLELMSDHSFQSVLKDLRDLYAIRNNLNNWEAKRDDFEVIIEARSVSLDAKGRNEDIEACASRLEELQDAHSELSKRAAVLDKEDQERVLWLLGDIQTEISSASMMLNQLEGAPGVPRNTKSYEQLINDNMNVLDKELGKTNELIGKVENVLLELVNAELDIHKERLEYYRIQSHLAKVRILDKSLSNLGAPAGNRHLDEPVSQEPAATSKMQKDNAGGDGDAA
jgi:tetratricopeptide (TPR) repeat protein